MMKREHYVYVLLRWDFTPMYVGMGKGRRWLWHESAHGLADKCNLHKANSVKKTLSILGEVPKAKVAESLSVDEAKLIEMIMIAALGRTPFGVLVNRTDGGDGVFNLPQDALDRVAAGRLGKPMYPKAQAALLQYWRTHSQSPEQRAKISAAAIGRKVPREAVERSAAKRTGAKRSEEAKQLMREAAIKRYASHEARAALSERGHLGALARWGALTQGD